MSAEVWALVLTAAVGHALWNLAARNVAGDIAILWLAFALGNIIMLPICAYMYWQGVPLLLTPPAVICLLATGAIHAVYFALLAWAYEHGEISLVYPVARGSGVGLTALAGWALLAEEITILGAVGIGCVLCGIFALGAPALMRGGDRHSFKLALYAGLSIVTYSIIDKIGVAHMQPVYYISGMWILSTLLRWPFVWRDRRGTFGTTARQHWRSIAFIGLGSLGTYLLILFAYTKGPVSYIVAARESSVVVGVILGFIFLRENVTRLKLIGVLGIAAGLALIKMG
jgi:drug/metabolite transporter (DMT)-like permease